jgi:hypothetical protein
MICPNCRNPYEVEDMYCSHCGTDLAATPSTSLVALTRNLPAVLSHPLVPRSVAAGVGAIAVGVGLELLRRNLLARLAPPKSVVDNALPALSGIKDILLSQNDKPLKPLKGFEIQETVIYMRRVIRR